jgi:hypothetical protein
MGIVSTLNSGVLTSPGAWATLPAKGYLKNLNWMTSRDAHARLAIQVKTPP